MIQTLILVSIICIICIIANKVSYKIGLPSLLLFIVIGMLFGNDGIFKIHFDDFALSEQICTIALIFIIFYGGFGINFKSAKPILGKAILLSTVGVVLTALITGLFCYVALGTSLLESMLVGSVLASTDAASVFSVLRSRKLNLKSGIAPLLELESASNDPVAYMLTTLLLGFMATNTVGSIPILLLKQIGFGILFGAGVGLGATWLINQVKFKEDGIKSIFVVAVALLGFALPTYLGGNGFLSVYIIGMILGNHKLKYKVDLVHFFDGVTQMMQMLLFFLLGLLANPSQIPDIIVPAILIALFLTFVVRPLVVMLLLKPLRVKQNERLFISWGGLRGAASIVFAILTVVSPAYTKMDIFHIVFFVSLLSVAFQGTFLPQMAKLLKVEDNSNNTMTTFNDYREEAQMNLIEVEIQENHPWVEQNISDIEIPQGMLIALIIRDEENVFPKGETKIEANDAIVMVAPTYNDRSGIDLIEAKLEKGHKWIGKTMDEIDKHNRLLVIMIRRNKNVIIPNGSTVIEENDYVVYCKITKQLQYKSYKK